MNIKDFAPLIGSLIKAGAPAIAGTLTLALTPEIGPLAGLVGGGVGDILPRIAAALGAPPNSSPADLSTKIEGDTTTAETALATLEADHTYLLTKQKQDYDYALASQAQQIAVNTVEAQNPSFFVAGWRPLVSWGTGAVAMMSFCVPYVVWVFLSFGVHIPPPPVVDPQVIYILTGLLGLGIVTRSVDKVAGVATTAIGGVVKHVTTRSNRG